MSVKIYTEHSVVSIEHAKVIKEILELKGSKIPSHVDLNQREQRVGIALCTLLSLACGGGQYRLSIDEINDIKNGEFEIRIQSGCCSSVFR